MITLAQLFIIIKKNTIIDKNIRNKEHKYVYLYWH